MNRDLYDLRVALDHISKKVQSETPTRREVVAVLEPIYKLLTQLVNDAE